jgi:hypothetical protein
MANRQDQDKQDRHEQAAASGMPSSVGIAVSKATLDVAVRRSGECSSYQTSAPARRSAATMPRQNV